MRTITMEYQPFILLILGIVCLFLALFTVLMKFYVVKMKSLLIRMEICTIALLVSTMLTYAGNGMSGDIGLGTIRVANTCSFFLNCLILFCYNEYVTILFMEKGRFKKLPDKLKLGYIICLMWIVVLCISIFFGWIYKIDSNNHYYNGTLLFIASLVTFAVVIIQLSFVIQYRHFVNGKLVSFLIFADLFLILSAIVQVFPWGTYMGQMAEFCVLGCLYGFTLREQSEKFQKAAYTDPQTGLPNSYGYLYEVDKIIRQGNITNYNAYYFDIVGMSNINNKYGKDKGDEIIKFYGEYINEWIKKNELFGRLGGNYFVALIERERTENFLKLLADTPIKVMVNDKNITVHVSAVAGCYKIGKNIQVSDQIMERISKAITYAKNIVKEPYVFIDDDMDKKINEEKAILERIQKGLRDEEFEPFYQPKVETENYELYGSEALARWRREGKLIPPFIFIPVMEKSGLVCSLDFYMLEHVCQDIRGWLDQGLNPPCVSVNFSRKNLSNPNLADDIYNITKKYDISPSLIQIEVTETNDGYPLSDLKKAVDALHDYGFSVAIDDFGTGSSSISLLNEVTFDVLKIDKTFVDYKDDKGKKLLAYIIEMSKAINVSVMAEGVEDMNQVQMLKDMDCTHIQGYVFDKPLEKTEYEDRLRRKKYDLIQ